MAIAPTPLDGTDPLVPPKKPVTTQPVAPTAAPAPVAPPASPLSALPGATPTAAPSAPTPSTAPLPAIAPVESAVPFAGPAPVNLAPAGPIGDTLPPASAGPTPYPGSAPLVATQVGGTMSAAATPGNQFAGVLNDKGAAGFGGYDSYVDPRTGQTMKQSDQSFVTNANQQIAQAASANPNWLESALPLAQWRQMQQDPSTPDKSIAIKSKMIAGQPVTPQELALVARSRGAELAQDTAAPTFGTFGTAAGNATAANPEEQKSALADFLAQPAAPAPAAGPAPESGAPILAPHLVNNMAPPNDAGTPTAPGAGGGPVSGAPIPASGGGVVATPGKINTAPVTPGAPLPATPTPTSPGTGGAVSTTPYTADKNLIDQTISRAPGADRFKIAQDQYDAAVAAGEPQYQAELRKAMQLAAAGGSLGSGQLNTSLGDIASTRDLSNRTMRTNFLDEALKGTIGDQFADTGIAQQQQGFQAGRSDTAFGQEAAKTQLQDTLQNSSFGRALQALLAGSSGNPADTSLILSQIFGNQATGASNALGGLISGTTANNATAGSSGTLQDIINNILKSYGSGGTSATPPTSSGPGYVNPGEG